MMTRICVLAAFLGLSSPAWLLKAAEFAVINEEITFTDASCGFKFWYDVNKGPTNWLSPDDYYNGQFYCRFEAISQPTTNASHLSFCIWGNPVTPGTHPETASTISTALTGAGSVVAFSSVPSTWWKQDGGVSFANRTNFYRWGIPHWGKPGILLAPEGYSSDPRSWAYWDQRTNYLPFRVKATVVAVSQGSTFSGWENYIGPLDTQPPTAPANLAVTSVTSNTISLDWTASTDNVGVTGYRVYRNGIEAGTTSSTSYMDGGLAPITTNIYFVKGVDAATNLSAASASVIGVTASGAGGATGMVRFRHFTIRDPLPGTSWGTGGLPLADLDGDGDMDCALTRRDVHGFWWYERRTDSNWVQHLISDSASLPQALGGAYLDVDDDGWSDLVFSGVWFKNPGTLRQNPDSAWTINSFAGAGHDILAVDISGDGRQDIVAFDGNNLRWFNPALAMASNTIAQSVGHHGGVTPNGAGDIDGDGDLDLVIAGYWYANPGTGVGTWTRYNWPHLVIPNASYGTSIRSWVVDMDGDSDKDIVYSDCDTGYSHVYWVRNEGRGTNWTRFALTDPPTAAGDVPGTGSFHSLGVADFDLDGDLDIFAGEQEDPDQIGGSKLPMKPAGLKERGVVWINSGGNPPAFTPQVIQVDNPGWHDAAIGDIDGDGDIDVVSKIWNKDGATYHADYWRNDTIIQLDNGVNLNGWHSDGGLWQVIDGAIVGQQNPPGSGNGGLLLSDQSFGDFETTFEVWPDWGVDTGLYTRTATNGKAYQVTIDYQTNNPMGGIYLSGIGDTGSWDFTLTGTNSIQGNPQFFTVSDWPNIWNPTGWNTFKVQVTNNPPRIITWINGTKIKDYQDSQVRLSSTGMVALQVHPTLAEWPNGAVTRFRNLRIKDLANNVPTPDTQAPTTPANFAVTGVSATSISLSWSPSTDNVAVTGYRVYRNGAEAGTCTAPSFTDAGLAANTTYGYAVRAYDAAANQSSASATITTNTASGGSTGAVPTQGLAFWVKADTGLTLNGATVYQWADQSGNNRHAIQATTASQPALVSSVLNGKPVLRFDGLNDFLSFSLPINGSTGLTLVLVSANSASRDPGVNQGNYAPIFWEETASWGWTYLSPFQTNVVMRFGTTQTGNLFKYTRPASINNSFTTTIAMHNGTTDSLYINGSLVMSAGGKLAPIAATVSSPYLGRGAGGTYFPGDIAEVLIYTRALSGPERIDLENYVRDRYLPSQLPSIQITNPTNNSSFLAPANITVAATAASSGGTITEVDFFADETFIGQKTGPPYNLAWTNVAPGSYSLTARATDNVGAAKISDPVLVLVNAPLTSPAAPTGLEATPFSTNQIRLTWADNATNETGYVIERKTGDGGTHEFLAALGANTTDHSDAGLAAGTRHYYRVFATNDAGASLASNEADAATPPAPVPPVLGPLANLSLLPGVTLSITNQAHDPNSPPQRLLFSLADAPGGAGIDEATGVITWRPTVSQAGTSNCFTVVVRQEGGWRTNLLPMDDAHVIESYPNANYGSQASLVVKLSATPGLTREAFLRFDVADACGVYGAVTEAMLRLMPTIASSPGTHALAMVTNNSWNEATLTWGNKPSSSAILATWVPQEGMSAQVPLAPAVQGALVGDGLLSLRLCATNSTADGLVYYGSKEGVVQNAPQLLVTATGPSLSATQSFYVTVNTPAPPSLALAGMDAYGHFKFTVYGDAGLDYTVQASTNLLDWATLLMTNQPVMPFEFVDSSALIYAARFYRTLLGP